MIERIELIIRGIVQGVGFRPFLFRAADLLGLNGTIQNRGDHVRALLEGERARLEDLVEGLSREIPRQARISSIEKRFEPAAGLAKLEIIAGEALSHDDFGLAPDFATCEACVEEFRDPGNRRYLYPLISCTDCGPRYTAIERLPYERANTSFAPFEMCAECAAEYVSPRNRRFHAETIACPACGPQVSFVGVDGSRATGLAAIRDEVARRLRAGESLGVKGLGGFQIVVDAGNARAVERLRDRKRRPHQAFAVMARDLECARRICRMDDRDAAWLRDSTAPILIVPRLEGSLALAALDLIAPDTDTLGIMLPPTALHHMLFADAAFDYLIATSGNVHGEPIALDDGGGGGALAGVVDGYLTFDRAIRRRSDDSVWVSCTRPAGRFRQAWRVGRGHAPIQLAREGKGAPTVLALGGELKNTIALAFGNRVIGSPHIGDLGETRTFRSFVEAARELPALLGREPEAIAVDLHPQYGSSIFGRSLAEERGLPLIEVQHHHAHAAACMLEHGLQEALALVFDGTGFGSDGTLWGGELLLVKYSEFTRLGCFRPAILPGGDAAVRQPWKQALVRLREARLGIDERIFERLGVSAEELASFTRVLDRLRAEPDSAGGVALARTSSVGRLFDTVAALVGLGGRALTYEGQAAVLLERAAARFMADGADDVAPYDLEIEECHGLWRISSDDMIRQIAKDLSSEKDAGWISARFHESLARAAARLVALGTRQTGLKDIVLSGGVFQNQILTRRLHDMLPEFRLHEHRLIPPGDGGIAIGQAAVASARL